MVANYNKAQTMSFFLKKSYIECNFMYLNLIGESNTIHLC